MIKHPQTQFHCNAPSYQWRVIDRNCNHSAFNGYRRTPSKYSTCECLTCGAVWRTKAHYVEFLEDRVASNSR